MYGFAAIEPKTPTKVGTCHTWTITYAVGESGVSRKGRIVLVTPKAGFSSPKLYPPEEPRTLVDTSLTGYVIASASRSTVRIKLSLERPPVSKGYGLNVSKGKGFIWPGFTVCAEISWDDLSAGDAVEFVYGDTSSGSVGAVCGTYAHKARFRVYVDPDGSLAGPYAGYHEAEGDLSVEVQPDAVRKLVVTVPSILLQGERLKVRVAARDRFENVISNYDGNITGAVQGMAFERPIRPRDLPEVSTTSDEMASDTKRVEVVSSDGLKARSNPSVLSNDPAAMRLFWGDIHVHADICDGLGTLEEAYEYARGPADIDFAAIASHDTLTSDSDWERMQEAARKFNEPGRFVSFLAYEYSERKCGGDKTVIFDSDDEYILRCIDEESNIPEKLWQKLQGERAITIPHSCAHPTMGTHWEYHNPHFQRLVEIYSEWGNSEYPGNPRPVTCDHMHEVRRPPGGFTVQEGLATGAMVGIIAASDNHSGQPGYCDLMGSFARRRAYHGGLAAVYARALDREEIWNALWERYCYGTTGARIILQFTLNGNRMGSEIELEGDLPRQIRVMAAGTDKIERIDIVRNNIDIHTHEGSSDLEEFEYEDADPIQPLLLLGMHSSTPTAFYYVRVTQEDGEIAWASPIWVFR